MNFSLTKLSDSFIRNKPSEKNDKYLLYAFLLATKADKNIFPEMMVNYFELDKLTADHILVFAPKIIFGSANGGHCDVDEVLEIFYTGKYRDPTRNNEEQYVSNYTERFLMKQTEESIEFARFCDIELSKIPCIVFFDSLATPKEYLIWELRDSTSNEIIKYFREIISKIEIEYKNIFELKEKRKDFNHEIFKINNSYQSQIDNIEYRIKSTENKIKNVIARKDKWEKSLEYYIEQKNTKRKKRREKKVNNAVGEIKVLKSEVSYLNSRLKEEKNNRINIEKKLIKFRKFIKEIELEIELKKNEMITPIKLVSQIDKKNFRRRMVSELKKSVPLINLGFSGVKIFT